MQSFEAVNLRDLHTRLRLRTPKVFLAGAAGGPFNDPTTYAQYLSPAGLGELSDFVDGHRTGEEHGHPPAGRRHARHARRASSPTSTRPGWCCTRTRSGRRTSSCRPTTGSGTDPTAYGRAIDEQVTFLRAGIDGLFTDNPDVGVLARDLSR